MATIEKITGKAGTTYRISVSSGFDTSGKRIRHRMAYSRNPGRPGRSKKPSSGPLPTLSAVLSRALPWITGRHLQNMPAIFWI